MHVEGRLLHRLSRGDVDIRRGTRTCSFAREEDRGHHDAFGPPRYPRGF